jgi:hypothetical protein
MDNPGTLPTLGTQDKDKQNTTQKTKMLCNTDPTKTRGEPGAREEYTVPVPIKFTLHCYYSLAVVNQTKSIMIL